MALKREALNRVNSPMLLVRETYDESRDEMERKKKKLQKSQKARSPFLIGSIDEINHKISKLDRKLQSYHELVVESRASEVSDMDPQSMPQPSLERNREYFLKKEKEAKEVNQFAGIYAIKSTFTPGVSERVKNISKISMNPSKSAVKKESAGKPRFAELHQYPGFESSELTPLPHDISALEILTKVAEAQPRLKQKPQYRPEFERLFYSQMSQAILQDTFWWFFLEKYQATRHYQVQLFNRISHNYVKLLTYAKHPQYRDVFLKDYPSLLSQAVYAAFCTTFPNSYNQFNSEFKEDLVNLIFDWVAGLRPAPRIWAKWNLEKLEPIGVKMREEIMNQSKATGKSSLINFDMLETTTHAGSQSTLAIGSASSMSSVRRPSHFARNRSRRAPSGSSSGLDSNAISRVADAQDELLSQKRRTSMKKSRRGSKSRTDLLQDSALDTLTPIREFLNEDVEVDAKESKFSTDMAKSYATMAQPIKKKPKESHPLGRGPDFSRGVFNICGQSPLVAHFMRMKNLQAEAGMKIRVQRTEIDNLPPVNTKTYREFIRDSFKHVRDFEKNYQGLVDRSARDAAHFIKKQRDVRNEHLKREISLLSKPKEVKRLSDLLMLELKKDHDSISTGATSAIQAALVAQE